MDSLRNRRRGMPTVFGSSLLELFEKDQWHPRSQKTSTFFPQRPGSPHFYPPFPAAVVAVRVPSGKMVGAALCLKKDLPPPRPLQGGASERKTTR
ncbi:hypothetical protein Pan258_20460 [Symmachiella dynata]|nr:hypothetical protein Pan258_20460 [Symmachiella dynata]